MVVNKLVESLRGGRGKLSELQFVLNDNPVAEYVQERFENKLAGWAISLTISTPNDITIC